MKIATPDKRIKISSKPINRNFLKKKGKIEDSYLPARLDKEYLRKNHRSTAFASGAISIISSSFPTDFKSNKIKGFENFINDDIPTHVTRQENKIKKMTELEKMKIEIKLLKEKIVFLEENFNKTEKRVSYLLKVVGIVIKKLKLGK